MKKKLSELSSRYYTAEITVWILGAVLIIYKVLGLKNEQSIPFIKIKLENQVYFPHILSAMLFVVLMYLLLEFKQSVEDAKNNFFSYFRVTITILWGGLAAWLIIPILVKNTTYEGVSNIWYLSFLGMGLLLGFFMQILSFATLMIRNPNESKTLSLPRIPNATRAQYIVWGPVIVILMVFYYILQSFAPESIEQIASFLTAVGFLYMVLLEVVFLCMGQDSNGNRISYKERISQFKEIHSFHDRSYELIDYGKKSATNVGINSIDSPKEYQTKIRDKFALKNNDHNNNFHVQQLEEIRIEFYQKDGNPENFGYRIHKDQGEKDKMRVLFKPDISEKQDIELSISINKIVKYAEKFILEETEKSEHNHISIFSKAVNQTVVEALLKMSGPPLPEAAMAGDIVAINELLKLGHDVNARSVAGWTALLAASAQGYPKIVKVLLDAGANPDISNVLGITPLSYGARYGNIQICKFLIDYGANLDMVDAYGDTALMKATQFGNISIVDILIKEGADISIKNLNNKNALKLAYEVGQGKIARKLRKKKDRYRDRDTPHRAPLPHHAAYGSVLRDSADQAKSDPGKLKAK